jgi:hypothetical protein
MWEYTWNKHLCTNWISVAMWRGKLNSLIQQCLLGISSSRLYLSWK